MTIPPQDRKNIDEFFTAIAPFEDAYRQTTFTKQNGNILNPEGSYNRHMYSFLGAEIAPLFATVTNYSKLCQSDFGHSRIRSIL